MSLKKFHFIISSVFITFALTCCLYSQSSWVTLQNSPYTQWRSDDVSFVNANTGWIVWDSVFSYNNTGKIYKTTDGGITWNLQFSLLHSYFRCIEFADSLNGWMGTLGSALGTNMDELYFTNDGGSNWQAFTGIQNRYGGLCGISVVDRNNVFSCGRVVHLGNYVSQFIKTTNGGLNWTYQNMNAYGSMLVDCYFFNKDTGYAVGARRNTTPFGNLVLYTTNGGTDWETVYSDSSDVICWKIFFVNRNTGYISNDNYDDTLAYLKTTDAGLNWTRFTLPNGGFTSFQQGIGFMNENTGWIGGGQYTFKTTNAGTSWFPDNFGININRFQFLSDTLAYAVGQKVYKFTSKTIGIHQLSSNVPDDFFLYQNYPNPFNPVTNLEFGISNLGFVTLKVFDVLGKEVAILVNEELLPGSYKAEFNGADLPSGVYFYKLETDNFTEVKRMILLK